MTGIKQKKYYSLLFILLIIVCSFVIGSTANADVGNFVSDVIGRVIQFFIWILGGILFVLIYILLWVAQYNDFIGSSAVSNGWQIVRDLCNMFFILILLIVAFATILKIESYNAKKLLPKLIIMAILINFSKTICGIFIDFAQVIMLTFVNGFKDMGSANLTEMLGIKDILAVDTDSAGTELTMFSAVGSYLLALIYTIIAVVVILVMVAVLVIRMIMLWIYIVLSPLAYLLGAFPAGQKYSQQWWSEFSKNVIIGPVLAFFIWLSFASLGAQSLTSKQILGTGGGKFIEQEKRINIEPQAGVTVAGTPDPMLKFIISIGMLMGGLMITQQLGGAAGSMAGKGIAAIQSGKAFAGKAAKLPFKGAKLAGSAALDTVSAGLGIDLNVSRGYKRLTAKMDERKRQRELKVRQKTLETAETGGRIRGALAHISTGDLLWQSTMDMYKDPGRPFKKFFAGGGAKREEVIKEQTEAKEERSKMWTQEEAETYNNETSALKDQKIEAEEAIAWQEHKMESIEEQSPEYKQEKEKLEKLKKNRAGIEQNIAARDSKAKEMKVVSPDKIEEQDQAIETYQKTIDRFQIAGITEAKAAAKAAVEGEESKKIASITNSQELGQILKDAIKDGNQGLIAAVTAKMTRNGDYNEVTREVGLGTGREGLQKFADLLKDKAGFTEQGALSIIGEMGNIAKNIGHFSAYGTVKMENGRWQKTSEKEYQAAMLSEMLKVQSQNFARNTNRLGLGYYDDGDGKASSQGTGNYHINDAAVAYMALNDASVADNYKKSGNQNAVEHLAIPEVKVKLQKAGAVEVLKALDYRGATGAGVDTAAMIDKIQSAISDNATS